MKRLSIVALLLLLPVGAVLLAISPAGTAAIFRLLDDLTPLEIDYQEGSLAGLVRVERLALLVDTTYVQLFQLEFEIEAHCLLYSKVCFKRIAAEQLDVEVRTGDEALEESDSEDSELYVFPVEIFAEQASLASVKVHWASGDWTNNLLTARVDISESRILITEAEADQAFLRLSSREDALEVQKDQIELPVLDLPLLLVIEELYLDEPAWSFEELTHQHGSLSVGVTWQNTRLEIEHGTVSSPGWGSVDLSGQVNFYEDWPIAARASVDVEDPPVWAGLYNRHLEVRADGSLASLGVSIDAAGLPRFLVEGEIDTLDKYGPFSLAVTADWQDDLPLSSVPGVEIEDFDVALISPWRLKAQGTLLKQQFMLSGRAGGFGYNLLEFDLAGQHEDLEFTVDSLALTDAPSDSSVLVDGHIEVADSLTWSLNLKSNGMAVPELSEMVTGRVGGSLSSRGVVTADQWDIELESVDVSGTVNDLPAVIQGNTRIDQKLLLGQSDLEASVKGAEFRLNVGRGGDANLQVNIEDAGQWLPGARGAVTFTARAPRAQRSLEFSGDGEGFSWEGLVAPTLRFTGAVDFTGNNSFQLGISLSQLRYTDYELTDIDVAASGDRNQQTLELVSRGDLDTRIVANGAMGETGWSGVLQPVALVLPSGRWALDRAVKLDWRDETEQLLLQDHCWVQGQASICPSKVLIGKEGRLNLEARSNLELLGKLVPEDVVLTGSLEADITAVWAEGSALDAKGQLFMGEGAYTRYAGEEVLAAITWEKVSLQGLMTEGAMSLEGGLWRRGKQQLHLDLALPASQSEALSGSLILDEMGLSGVLKPFMPSVSNREGQLDGKLLLSGSVQTPLAHGALRLSGGEFSVVGNPTTVEQLDLAINAQGEYADVEGTAVVGGGPTRLVGKVLLRPEPRVELEIVGEEQTFLLPPGIEATVSEHLQLVAMNNHLELRGDITVHEGVLEHAELPEGGIDVSPDVVEVDYEGREISDRSLFDLAMDVRVDILDAFQVVSTGLESTVGGQLSLLKEPAQPMQLFGELNILDGQIDAFGQNLKIRRGNVSFVGEPGNPDLNVRAEREIRDESVTVGVEVLGNLDEFAFNLYSTPAMQESEMMSYLIRGRGVDKGAASDGAGVALSLGMGAMNQTGVVEGINRIPGLNNVSFGTDGDANMTTATLGGYVGTRLYLAYGVGVYEPINVLTTRFYLQSRLWLEVVSALESSADIYYSFDIE